MTGPRDRKVKGMERRGSDILVGGWFAEEEMAGQRVGLGRIWSGISRQDRCLVRDKRLRDWRIGDMDKGDGGGRVYICRRWELMWLPNALVQRAGWLAGRRGGGGGLLYGGRWSMSAWV